MNQSFLPRTLAFAALVFAPLTSTLSLAGDQLIPVTLTGKPIPPQSSFFGTPQKFAIASLDGEPIRFNLVVSDQPPAPVEIVLHDESGQSVAANVFEAGEHEIELSVPTPGTYYLDITNNKTFWRITIPENTSAVLLLEPGKPMLFSGGMLKRFFYVPKGTEEVRFTAESGHPTYQLEILDPEGNVAQTFTEQNSWQPIAIPPGMDGQVWGFNGVRFAPKQLFFENIPNYLASSPDALLIPKELVEKDGL